MLMKWLVRLAFPALGLLMLLIFFGINAPDAVVVKTEEPKPGPEIPSFEGLVPSPVPTEGPEIVFKWQDSDGSWHYADRPPAQGNWNALAIEPAPLSEQPALPAGNPETDWQSPYQAPFALTPRPANNGS